MKTPILNAASLILLALTSALASPELPRDLDTPGLVKLAKDGARAGSKLSRKLDRLYPGHDASRKQAKRDQLVSRWLRERDQALEVIFDKTIYPDENHGEAGQATVDAHVNRVRAAYAALDASQRKDLKKLRRLDAEQAAELLDELQQTRELLAGVAELQAERGLDATPALEVPPALEALVAQQAGRPSVAVDLERSLNVYDRWLLQRVRDDQVRMQNAAVLRATPSHGVLPSGGELEQVQLTNAYRMQMGRCALRLDTRLVESARAHSADMVRLDFFAHESPVDGKEHPADRMALTGYPNPGGENIYMGRTSAQAAHDGWYHSSGHHRNLLASSYAALGTGQDGAYWTQNFGR